MRIWFRESLAAQEIEEYLCVAPPHVGVILAFGRLITEIPPSIDHLLGRPSADAELQALARNEIGGPGVLGAVENIVLGQEPERGPFLDAAAAAKSAATVLADLGVALPLDRPARRMSVAQQQTIEICKSLVRKARLIVMDEPTAALTDREIDALFALIKRLQGQGVAFVYISHRLEELPRIADRITVLVYGNVIASGPPAEIRSNSAVQEAYLGAVAA